MLRRKIISGLGAAAALSLVSAGKASASRSQPASRDVLLCLFLRGGADGLNLLVPHGDDEFYTKRGAVGIPRPGETGGAIDLDGYFGLHPAFEDLYTRAAGDLAFVPAAGNPLGSHSHFDAMQSMEYGNGGLSAGDGGWLARYLGMTSPAQPDPTVRGMAVNSSAQKSLLVGQNGQTYPARVMAALSSEDFQLNVTDEGQFQDTLASLYRRSGKLDEAGRALLELLEEIELEQPWTRDPANGAVYPAGAQGLGGRLQTAANFICALEDIEVVCVDMGGWDTHSNERARLNQLVTELAGSLEAFYQDMGDAMANITVLVMTEFGRRIGANNSNGTDHGTASCMIALGGGVNGGVYDDHWEGGLAGMSTHHGDVKVGVDFRNVCAQLLQRRMAFTGDWAELLPNHGLQELGFELFQQRPVV